MAKLTPDKLKEFIKNTAEEYKKDVEWDETKAIPTSMSIASKSAKYINIWQNMKTLLITQIEPEYNKLFNIRYSFYKESDIKYSSTEIKDILNRDESLSELRQTRELLLSFLEMLEKYIKNIEGIRFDIKCYTELLKITNGVL